jgi:hypothetical protein
MTTSSTIPEMMTLTELAEKTGLSRATLWSWTKRGYRVRPYATPIVLKTANLGRTIRITLEDFAAFREEVAVARAADPDAELRVQQEQKAAARKVRASAGRLDRALRRESEKTTTRRK